MPYIIENATILRETRLNCQSILTDGKVVSAVRENIPPYAYTKMTIEPFLMTPAYTILDGTLPNIPADEITREIEARYLKKGCTTVLTFAEVEYERDLHTRVLEVEERL